MMAGPFHRYPLGALETLYAYRLEQARLRLASAQRKLDKDQASLRQLQLALNRCHEEWTAAVGGRERFDPAHYAAAREALAVRQTALVAALGAERESSAEVDRCRADVTHAYRRAEAVGRHKEQFMHEHAVKATRIRQNEADEAWSLRGRRA